MSDSSSISVPPYVYEILGRNKNDGAFFLNLGLAQEFSQKLEKTPNDIWNIMVTAQLYHTEFKHGKALELYLRAASLNPGFADPLIGVGKIFYDLALLDMFDRHLAGPSLKSLSKLLVQPSPISIVCHPDEKVWALLLEARKLLERSKGMPRMIRIDPGGARLYITEPGTEDRYIEMIDSKINWGIAPS